MMKKFSFFMLCFVWFFFVSTSYADIKIATYVDKNPVALKDTFHLILTLPTELTKTPIIDFSPLQNDFTIIEMVQGDQDIQVNGKSQQVYQWVITLKPKREGKIIIPAFTIGQWSSNSLIISVVDNVTLNTIKPSLAKQEKTKILLNATVNNPNPYVLSSIIYTLNIYFDHGLQGTRITQPKISGLKIEPVGQDKLFTTKSSQSSHHEQFFQKQYLITVSKPGKYDISPTLFVEATHSDIKSNLVHIEARAMPANYTKWMFPAENLVLREMWSYSPQILWAGKPVTRIVTIHAEGIKAELLPIIQLAKTADYFIHAEKPVLINEYKNHRLFATSTTKITYTPKKTGPIKLPSIEMYWWDTKSHKLMKTWIAEKNSVALFIHQSKPVDHSVAKNTPAVHHVAHITGLDFFSTWLLALAS